MSTDPALSLAKIQLHVEQLVPRSSASSYEALKASDAAMTASLPPEHDSDKHQEVDTHPHPSHHLDSWTKEQITDRLAWMRDFKPNKKGGGQFLDQEVLKKQQGVFKEIMMQVGAQLLTGKLAVRISLPVRIFEPRTLLERVADGWNYAPTLLKKAALSKDPLERMKFVIAFVVGGFHFCVVQFKPFNPILGETYEATYPDGTQIYLEHVCHHPVASAFDVHGPHGLYRISGRYEFESVTSRNSIYNHQIGTTKITFHDGHSITYTLPQIKMSGILFGDRVVELAGTATFEDAQNNLVGEVNTEANAGGFLFGKAQADDIKGQIHSKASTSNKSSGHLLSVIQGSWLTHLQCDGKVYWHIESEPAFEHKRVAEPLLSDCGYREDLQALARGDLELAQREKLRLEELQRSDRKAREDAPAAAKASQRA